MTRLREREESGAKFGGEFEGKRLYLFQGVRKGGCEGRPNRGTVLKDGLYKSVV